MPADTTEKACEFYQNFAAIHNQVHSGLVRALSKPFVEPEVYFTIKQFVRLIICKLWFGSREEIDKLQATYLL